MRGKSTCMFRERIFYFMLMFSGDVSLIIDGDSITFATTFHEELFAELGAICKSGKPNQIIFHNLNNSIIST